MKYTKLVNKMGAILALFSFSFKSYSNASSQTDIEEIKETCWKRNIGTQVETKSSNIDTQTEMVTFDKGQQVKTECLESGSQTFVSFEERLTEFGTNEVGSNETFGHTCVVCEKEEIEAVGHCWLCDQYMCLRCCQYHEKWNLSKTHTIVSKSCFEEVIDRKRLFVRHLVPVTIIQVPREKMYSYGPDPCLVRSLIFLEGTNDIAVLDSKYSESKLKVIKENGLSNTNYLKENCNMLLCLSSNKNELIVTVPYKQKVMKINLVATPVKPMEYFQTSGECWGIAEFDSGFAVSVKVVTGYLLPDWQVQYLDYKGKIKKQIYYDGQDKALFSIPEFLASNPKQDLLYVSDRGKCAVIALNVIGEVVFTFTNDDMKSPKGLTVDNEHNVYVACGDKVIQIHKDGAKHRVLIQKTKDTPDILSVFFNTASETLITGEVSEQIKTFTFLK